MVQSTLQHQCNGVCPNPSLDIQDGTQIYSWSRRQRQQVGACSPWFRAQGFPGSGTAQLNRKTKWWWIGKIPSMEGSHTHRELHRPACGNTDGTGKMWGPGCSNQPDTEYQSSEWPECLNRVLQVLSLTFFMLCVFQVRSLRPIHWWICPLTYETYEHYQYHSETTCGIWVGERIDFSIFVIAKSVLCFSTDWYCFPIPDLNNPAQVGRKERKLKIDNLRWLLRKMTSFIYAPAKMGWNGYYISQWPLLLHSGTGASPTPRCPIAPSLANSSESLFVPKLQLHCCWVIL